MKRPKILHGNFKLRVTISILVSVIMLIVAGVIFEQFAQTAQKEMKIKVQNYASAPYRFDDIVVEGVSLQKQLDAKGEYFEARFTDSNIHESLKKLRFRYTNISNWSVVRLDVVIVIQHPNIADLGLAPIIYYYRSKGDSYPPILPGQSIIIEANRRFIEQLDNFAKQTGLTDWSGVQEATIRVLNAEFSNGNTWEHEGMHRPDPDHPGEKIRMGYPKISRSEMDDIQKKCSFATL